MGHDIYIYIYIYICIYIYVYIYIYIYSYVPYMLLDHLAVCTTVVMSAVVWPIIFSIYRRCMFFFDKRWFLKPFQPLSKFSMVTFVVSNTVGSIFIFFGESCFWIFGRGAQKGGNFQRRRTKLGWNYGTKVKRSQ